MQNLRLLHNRIKLKTIESIRTSRSTTATEIMVAHGGILASSRDRELTKRQEWSLPKTALNVLTVTLGISEADIRTANDRLYVSTVSLQGVSVNQHKNKLIAIDLCCGKFGDMAKYFKNDVAGIIGVDNEYSLMVEMKDSALNRWIEFRNRCQTMDSCFVLADCRQPLMKTLAYRGLETEADVVGCFFALHYFFSSERDARSFFQNVKDLLKPNGIFIGTLIDGGLMLDKLREFNGVYHHRASPSSPPLFTVLPVNFDHKEKPSRYGAHIDVQLHSTILEQYETAPDLKQENLVDFNDIIDLASEYDLELVQTETFNQYFPLFPDIVLSPELAAYSSTHRTFKFRKISRSAAPTTSFHHAITRIQMLQLQQVESKNITNDITNERAADEATLKTSIVQPWSDFEQTDKKVEDNVPLLRIDSDNIEMVVTDKKRERVEVQVDENFEKEPKQSKVENEPNRCTTRCLNGNCKACACKRKFKTKCTDECGCGPSCTNR